MRVVLFELRDGMEKGKIESLLQAARDEIPGLVEVHFGANKLQSTKFDSPSKRRYTHVLVSRHEQEKSLEEYLSHPRYRELTQYIYSFSAAQATAVCFYANGRPHL
ncbi:uncharacterized protein Tco025E_06781 [Trypanosoma conorhini]|uniref:Stress-response A/B barrel domain-containing protein n=1 Tax=Trypanosoma conorhini TaxID=83891 RepID=A0A422NYL0_9TRYP|nr:uncharacterized protein Tco025E_06781 [Trypanosoma conorhini]RNF10524.1 hypothetical protein Tco025E_06781 [Trypanosoma conorhini]